MASTITVILLITASELKTTDGLLLILEVQLAGKKLQSAWNFINGSRLEIGEKLGA